MVPYERMSKEWAAHLMKNCVPYSPCVSCKEDMTTCSMRERTYKEAEQRGFLRHELLFLYCKKWYPRSITKLSNNLSKAGAEQVESMNKLLNKGENSP